MRFRIHDSGTRSRSASSPAVSTISLIASSVGKTAVGPPAMSCALAPFHAPHLIVILDIRKNLTLSRICGVNFDRIYLWHKGLATQRLRPTECLK